MTNDVAQLLAELQQDHHNMRLLLDLLERETALIFEGGEPDYELLFDVMHYMTVYPDAVHHPKEDRLYGEMREVRPDLTAGFRRISVDHREIAEAGRRVRDNLASIAAGNVHDRKAVVAETMRYVNNLRGHMQWEELDLFRRCRAMAREGHAFLTVQSDEGVIDPLFGDRVATEFRKLHGRIRASAAARERARGAG